MKRAISLGLAILMVASLMAACGTAPSSAPASPSVSAITGESVGKIIGDNVQFDTGLDLKGELNVWFYEDGKPFIEELFEDYQKYRPNVKLNVTYIPWGDYWKKLPVAISGGNGPDVFYFHNMYHNLMVDGGLMRPYSDILLENLRKDYKNVNDTTAADGNIYYIGVGGGHGLIFYNKALWAEAGLTEADIPETWEELREIAKKLTKKEGDNITVSGFNYNPGGGMFVNDWSYLAGRFMWSEDGKDLAIDNEEFKKSMQFFVDLYKVDGVCTPEYPEYMQSFKDGTTAMLWNHPFYAGQLRRELPGLEFGVFPQPKFEGMARNWHYNNPDVSMGINSKISDEQAVLAEDLLTLFFADEKYMKSWCQAQVLAPTKTSLENDSDLIADPVIQVLMEDFDNSLYVGPAPDAVTQDIIQNLVDPVLKGGVGIDEAVANTMAKAHTTLVDFEWTPMERQAAFADELK